MYSRRVFIRSAVYATIGLAGATAYAQSDNLEVIHADVAVDGLSSSLDGLTIGVMTDFHAGAWGNREVIARAIQSMNDLQPDVITLLGDYVDGARSHDGHNIDKGLFLFEQLGALSAPQGVYAVLGNHDHWIDKTRITRLLSQRNITVLTDQHSKLSGGLVVAGVDDYWEGPGSVTKALTGVKNDATVILLSHNPDINMDIGANDPVKLVLAGHTHGGQIRVPFTGWAPWVPCSRRYKGRVGLFRETENRWSFISKGIGTFLLPVRFSCPPDIAILTLRKV